MKIKTLTGENIYSFDKFFIDFLDYAGLISIILGKNLDQKTANGAGKTSILKALYWALWNKELNGATIDEMINRTNPDKGMYTLLCFEDRGYDYQILRYKNYKPNKNSPKLHDGNVISGSGVEFLVNGEPLMGESHSKTQLIIEQKLRMTPRLFLSCVLMAQNTRTNFLTANDTEKKELLSELLDLQAYDKAFKAVKESIKDMEDRISVNENKIETLNEQIENNTLQYNKLSEDELSYIEETKIKVSKLEMEISSYVNQISELKKTASLSSPAEELKNKIQAVEDRIKKIKVELASETALIQAISSLDAEIQSLDRQEKEGKSGLEIKNKKIIDLQSGIKEINITELSNKKEEAQNQKNLLVEKIKGLEREVSQEKNFLVSQKDLESKVASLSLKINDLSKHIQEAKDDALCPTCLRKFQDGENQSLDKVIENFTKQIAEETLLREDYTAKLETIKNSLLALEGSKNELKNCQDKLQEIDLSLSLINEQEQNYKLQKQQNKMIESQIKELNEEIKTFVENEDKFAKQKKILEGKKTKVLELQNDLNPLKVELVSLEESIADQRKQLSEAEGLYLQIQQAKRELVEKQNLLKDKESELIETKNKANPYSAMKENIFRQTEGFKERLKKHKELVDEAQDELKYLNFWKLGFAPVGIRSFITDDVIELLNRKTQENLNDLFDGAITVMFDPESKNNKGIVSNKISTVFLYNGKETNFALLSGGEQQRAILATELALTEVAEARAGTKLNLRFLDEPFTGMDNNGQVKSLSLFSRIAREKDGFFVISHDENFQHLCQKAMFVVKHKEISHIVDKAQFNSATIDLDLNTSSGYEEGENLDIAGKDKPKKKFDLEKALKKKKELEEDDFD